jgi:tetratricopeptide (TPR) repeat protein
MKKHVRVICALVFGFAAILNGRSIGHSDALINRTLVSESALTQGRNEVAGTVFGESRRPVADMFVELLDDVGSTVNRTKTNASGRFVFGGLPNGRYIIKVLPYGSDYLEQTQEVTLARVSAISGSGSDRQQIDIYLKLNERANTGPFAVGPGTIFAQDVPLEAQKFYREGINYLKDKKEAEGFASLRKALEIFPNYYIALDKLGGEYALKGTSDRSYFEAALILLTKAVEVNPRGFSSVFGLGWTQYNLGLNDEAVVSLRRATTLYAKSADTYLWLGKALKRTSMLDQAEAAFKRANELTNGKVADVHWQMAGLYSAQKRYKEAADELELFLKTQPNAADAEKIRALIKQLREKPSGS